MIPLFEEVARIVASVLRQPAGIEPGSLADQVPGWDSHATVEIIFAVEDRFGFQMSAEQMESVTGIASLIDIVSRATGVLS